MARAKALKIPLQKALDENYEKIVVILTRPENYRKQKENLPYLMLQV